MRAKTVTTCESRNQHYHLESRHAQRQTNGTNMGQTAHRCYVQDAQLSQRDRAAGCVIVFAKSRRLELGDNILRTL